MKVEEYLNKKYERTKWTFTSYNKIFSMFGEEGRKELTRLKELGKVRGRKGANGPLVELIKF